VKFVGGGVGAGVGVGVRVGVGEGYGEGVGEGEGEGEGVGATCCDTVQIHVCIVVPFSFVATADTFHVPATALVFV